MAGLFSGVLGGTCILGGAEAKDRPAASSISTGMIGQRDGLISGLDASLDRVNTLWSSSEVIKNPILQKAWKVITWRWRLQLAINAPFGVLWVADKTNPAVHAFDMSVLAALHAEWLAPMMGIA